MKRIGVLTSGGDSPGMNPCIRAVTRVALNASVEVSGIRRGYRGLIQGDIHPLGRRQVGGIIQRGGTFLQTARCREFETEQGRLEALHNLNEHEIEGLIVIGGDGSQRGAYELHKLGFPVVGVPASIDNDLWGTDMAIGVDTALNTVLQAVDKLRDTASSHHRAFLIEVMGRKSGYLALMGGLAGGAELVLIPEKEISLEEIAKAVKGAYIRGKAHAIVVIAEGFQHRTTDIAQFLTEHEIGFEVRVTILGHVQRGGLPSVFDRILATRLGAVAVNCLLNGQRGVMVGLRGGEIKTVPLEEVATRERGLDLDYYDLAEVLAK
ncbi:MAG: 6-phosphofructokinase [Anaerolineae bacterium]